MNQELLMQANMMERQIQSIRQNLEFVETQISEFEAFKESIEAFIKSDSKEMFASLGKGIHIKSELKDKNFLVEVGAGVAVKKTPQESLKIIDSQISKFHEAKSQLASQEEMFLGEFQRIIHELDPDHQHHSH